MNDPSAKLEGRVLVLAPTGRDALLTESLLAREGMACEVCPDVEQLCTHLQQGAGAAIVAEEALGVAAAERFTQELARLPAWSDPPLIVLTGRGGAEATQRLVRALGPANLTLLERPVQTVTLVSAVQSALRARRRQYQMRDLLGKLERGVEERDRFLAILSHELRNPLATIMSTLTLIEEQKTCQSCATVEQRQVIARQAQQLARLIDDLLDVSRVTAGKITLQKQAVDLKAIVSRSVEALQAALRSERHELAVTEVPGPIFVEGDPARLEQVVINLLGNAIKYTSPGGHIRLSVEREGRDAVLQVADDGVGLSKENLERLFEPFIQVDTSLDRAQGGLGLGLALVRRLVEMQGGDVSAASDGVGRGSTFTVRLPLGAAPAAAAAEAPARPEASRRVLLVEDRADARRVMKQLLELWGHRVEVAEDGPEGVAKALEVRPEVALVDLGLPGLDGYEVARRIRGGLGGEVFLVALTGYGQPDDRQRTQAAGFDLHLVKPVEPAALRQLLGGASLQPKRNPAG